MEQVICACGCGQSRPKYDRKGRARLYIAGHQNRTQTEKQIQAARKNLERARPRVPWNKGRTYVIASKREYANKGSWNKAMRRLYADECMHCGWNQAPCDTHHITPKENGGKYSVENGVILCPNCHRLAHIGALSTKKLREAKSSAAVICESV